MTTKSMHTPTPYEVKETNIPSQVLIVGCKDRFPQGFSLQIDRPTGEFIVRACNSHAELLELLEALKRLTEKCEQIDAMLWNHIGDGENKKELIEISDAKEAIAKAQGGA